MKKTYVIPAMKVRAIDNGSILEGSQQMYNEVGKGGQKAKGNLGFEPEEEAVNANSTGAWNAWGSDEN